MFKRIEMLMTVLVCLLYASNAFPQVPRTISYQGILADGNGTPVPDGNYQLTFKLYDVETGGSPLWTETQSVAVQNGVFDVILGSVSSLDLPFDKPYWVGVTIGDGSELSPRIELTSAAYSFRSANTDSINGIAAGGDLAGTYPNPTIANGAVTTEKIADAAVTQEKLAPNLTLPPSGAAGGDLTGDYPNPTIANNAVATGKIANSAITTEKIANAAVTTTKIADAAITQEKLAPNLTLPPSGPAGGDLTGNYPNPSIANNAVVTQKIANSAVTTEKIANSAITTEKIANSAVTQEKLAPNLTLPPSGAAGGDLTGDYPNPSIANNAVVTQKIANSAVTTEKIANSAITTEKIANSAVTQEKLAPNLTLPPSGAAGGDLTGDYPNPTIANNAVVTQKIANSAVTTEKIANSAITTEKIANSAVTQEKLAPNLTLPPSGAAGGDLTGDYPNPSIANNAVVTQKIANSAVTTEKIANSAITTEKIANSAVTQEKLAPNLTLPPSGAAGGDLTGDYPNPSIANNAVVTQKIANSAITTEKIANSAITTEKIANSAVTQEKLAPNLTLPPSGAAGGDLTGDYPNPSIANNAVVTQKIANSAVTTEKIANSAITTEKIANSAVTQEKLAPNLTLPPSGAAGGDLTGDYPNPSIANNAVVTQKIANSAVTTEKIANSAITTEKIANSAVTQEKLAPNLTLPPSGAAGGDLTGDYPNPSIANNAVVTQKIANSAVTTEKIANSAITTEKIANSAVTTIKIATGAINKDKLSAPGGSEGQVLKLSSDGLAWGNDEVKLPYAGTVSSTSDAFAIVNTGNGNSIYGRASGTSKSGVYGYHTGNGYGVYGHSDGKAIFGKHHTTGNYGLIASKDYGVYGEYPTRGNFGSIGTAYHGVYGSSPNGYGVYGYSSYGYAGYFVGKVRVTGMLSKGGGSFVIDHPLDPANKYLCHSFVESPDMMNIYNGNITLDANGEAWVELPSYFEALNKDYRYQLTAIGEPAPNLYIAQEISGNRFKIAGGKPGMKVSWLVTGIRKDPFAEAHRIQVEVEKTGSERGRYLHPREYGVSEGMGIGYDEVQKIEEE